MSNKNQTDGPRRAYTQKVRAQKRQQIHRRITLAAIYLHGTVGPARTTMGEIAKRAGVQRATVYNHFPSELELIDACSSHWFRENPPPDPAGWAKIKDPRERAEKALIALYDYYDQGHEMLENVLRDVPQVPALEEIIRVKWWPMIDRMVMILVDGWLRHGDESIGGTSSEALDSEEQSLTPLIPLKASIKVALDFYTWHTLAASGLSNKQAARLATEWIEVAL